MKPHLFIGFTGKKQSGKTSCAEEAFNILLTKGYQPHIRGFADCLKQELANLFATTVEHIEKNKNKLEMRWILQRYGTEFRRAQATDYWVDEFNNSISNSIDVLPNTPHAFLIPDVRFANEYAWVKSRSGHIINVRRPGQVEVDTHDSEAYADIMSYDTWIDNDRTKSGLKSLVSYALNNLHIV